MGLMHAQKRDALRLWLSLEDARNLVAKERGSVFLTRVNVDEVTLKIVLLQAEVMRVVVDDELPPASAVKPGVDGCKHVKLSTSAPGSEGSVILLNLTGREVDELCKIALLWNEANVGHARPYMSVEVL